MVNLGDILFIPRLDIRILKYVYFHSSYSFIKKTIEFIFKSFLKNKIRIINKSNNIKLDVDFTDYIPNLILKSGIYEGENIIKCIELIQPTEGIFIDIGANIGLYSIIINRITNRKTISFEASPINFSSFLNNLQINKFKEDEIIPCDIVLSDKSKVCKFGHFLKSNTGMSKIINPQTSQYNDFKSFLVNTATINSILSFLEVTTISLIKMDVEGSEYDILSNFDFEKWRPKYFQIELLFKNEFENSKRVFDLLINHNYIPFTLEDKPVNNSVFDEDCTLYFKHFNN